MNDSRYPTKDDEVKIREAALDYIGGVLEANPARMERCLHPELAKRAYLPGVDGKPQLSQMSALNLIWDARTWRVVPNRHAEVVILDSYEGAASVRTTFDHWIDYMHIVKVGDDWKIINVLWELTPEAWGRQGGKPRSSEPAWPHGH
jgi:hypothetical protein